MIEGDQNSMASSDSDKKKQDVDFFDQEYADNKLASLSQSVSWHSQFLYIQIFWINFNI